MAGRELPQRAGVNQEERWEDTARAGFERCATAARADGDDVWAGWDAVCSGRERGGSVHGAALEDKRTLPTD